MEKKWHELTIEGLDFRVKIQGNGPKVLLLHGYGGKPIDWVHTAERIFHNYQVIIPDLSPLYYHGEPKPYRKQVRILSELIEKIIDENEGFHLAGTSYGGTLSWGVRFNLDKRILSHSLVNPMPFKPLDKLSNPVLKAFVQLSRWPDVFGLAANSYWGKRALKSLARYFRVGGLGGNRIRIFNPRKMKVVIRAMRRFQWVSSNEDWDLWQYRRKNMSGKTLLIYTDEDRLFQEQVYEDILNDCQGCTHQVLKGGGHFVVLSQGQKIGGLMIDFMSSIEPNTDVA